MNIVPILSVVRVVLGVVVDVGVESIWVDLEEH